MRYCVLGQLAVIVDEHPADIGSRKQRMLLGVLLRYAGDPVSADRLVDALWWDGSPPSSALANLRVYVHKLRKALGADERITFGRHGYALTVRPDELDAHRFEDLVRQGRRAAEQGDAATAATTLRAALDLWHGPAYGDLTECPVLRDEATRLDEMRLAALEERLDADLSLGRHAELIPELRALTAEHALRERFRAQLMLALYRADRQAEALRAYQDARRILGEELGIEPGPKLRRLHESILAGDPALDLPEQPRPAAQRSVPAGLPPDVGTFTGRQDQVDRLAAALRGAGQGPLVICALAGAGGIGKSALAIHAAHLVADRFPDGQLYVDLHGATPGLLPLAPDKVLGRFLRSLGVEGEARVDDVDEAAERFRSATADRRVLVVLDNAADAAQVRTLLPGGPGCAVLVTCRRVLSALDGAVHLRLEALPEPDAVALLARFTDPDRVAAEPDAAAEIVRLCGYLPLAVRIAAARLAARCDWSLGAFADRLTSARNRLDELQHADLEVRASFAVAHGGDGDDSAHVFSRLGLLDLPDITARVAAVLADWPVERTEAALDRLLDSQLLEVGVADRFRMHDLVRLHAREQADRLEDPDRHDAVTRVLHYHLATVRRAGQILDPGNTHWADVGVDPDLGVIEVPISGRDDAVDWLDSEADSLVALTRQAVDKPGDGPALAVGLATALSRPLELRGSLTEWLTTAQLGLQAAIRSGNDVWLAHAQSTLGIASNRVGRVAESGRLYRDALAVWRRVGNKEWEARVCNNLGIVLGQQGDLENAVAQFEQGLDLWRELGDQVGENIGLQNLGIALRLLGNLEDSIRVHEMSVGHAREMGDMIREGAALGPLGETQRLAGHLDDAIANLERAIMLVSDAGDRDKTAEYRWSLGLALHASGKNDQARAQWAQSVAILKDSGALTADEARDILASGPVPKTPDPIRLQG